MLKLHIKAVPNAKKEGFCGKVEFDGKSYLKLGINAPAIEGRANAAIVAFLSKYLGASKRDIDVAFGLTGKYKTVIINSDKNDVLTAIEELEKL